MGLLPFTSYEYLLQVTRDFILLPNLFSASYMLEDVSRKERTAETRHDKTGSRDPRAWNAK